MELLLSMTVFKKATIKLQSVWWKMNQTHAQLERLYLQVQSPFLKLVFIISLKNMFCIVQTPF